MCSGDVLLLLASTVKWELVKLTLDLDPFLRSEKFNKKKKYI